jgi:hypothetical protein
MKKEIIDITPDISLLPKIGRSGYTLTQSLAELVDNSIDARRLGLTLNINIVLQNNFIIVEDDGSGMDRKTAEKALVLGYSSKKDALGEFGLGLKSACTSLGRNFTLETYQENSKFGYRYQYDEERWESKINRKDWTDELIVFEKEPEKYGTHIKIENLKRSISKQRKKDVLNDFRIRFAPFLKSGDVTIFVNHEKCVPEEPELTEEGKTSFEMPLENGAKIFGWYGLMKKGSDKGLYGFNTFRRGRMITCYDKIGIPHHPTVARIIGDIHLDHVPVSHNKTKFETESDEYKQAVELLEHEFKELVKKARQTSLATKVTNEVKIKTEMWKEAIVRIFHRDIKDLIELEPIKKKRSYGEDDPIGEVEIEKRDSPLHETIREIIAKRERTREPRDKRQQITTHFITIRGKNYIINHDFANLGINESWKACSYSKEKATIEVFTNQDFPAYAVTNDIPFYAAIHIAESIAEIVVKVNDYDPIKINEIKEKFLRGASEIVGQFE